MLSESDQKKLDEIIDRSDKGELKLYNDDEIKERLAEKGLAW